MANRRNVLIGLGSLVAGGGALLGTGAFTSVEADRTVSVETTGDASALLALTPADHDDDQSTDDNPYVTGSDDGQIQINLDGSIEGEETNATGLNENAKTVFNELVAITNNGTEAVDSLSFSISTDGGADASLLSVIYDGSPVSNDTDVLDSPINAGDDVTFGLEVDLLGDSTSDDLDAEFTLTITAESDDA